MMIALPVFFALITRTFENTSKFSAYVPLFKIIVSPGTLLSIAYWIDFKGKFEDPLPVDFPAVSITQIFDEIVFASLEILLAAPTESTTLIP